MEFAACDLVVPTRFAACGQFLVDVGECDSFTLGWRRCEGEDEVAERGSRVVC